MAPAASSDSTAWIQAQWAAVVVAVDPAGLGGVLVRAGAGPVRDAWLQQLRALLPCEAPLRRIPLHVQDDRLLGGLDLSATLAAGRAVSQRGLLAEADGGVVVLAMAERVGAGTAARVAAVLDTGEVQTARDGVTLRHASRIGVLALDEGGDDEHAPSALMDRLGLWLDLSAIAPGGIALSDATLPSANDVAQARTRVAAVRVSDDVWSAFCAAAQQLGIASLRAPLHAARVARALAALDGRDEVQREDAAMAARWVLGPRAQMLPSAPDGAEPSTHEEASGDETTNTSDPESAGSDDTPPGDPSAAPTDELVLAAAAASVPARLLDRIALRGASGQASADAGGAGASRADRKRGAPIGVLRGDPRTGQRLNVLATLRAAAPWQRLRQAHTAQRRVVVRVDDFRITRFRQQSQTTVIFVVDASGSAALHRLAEAKGAVELLLADCYARRDSVAVLAFRGQATELLLPPTRSLVRARRSLAGLPGGGGTPLASAIDAAATLAGVVRRRGNTPLTVLLTDGRANVARDGAPGRERACAEALMSARRVREAGLDAMLLDTSPRPHPLAQRLAAEMGAVYLPMPHADAARMSAAVRSARRDSVQERA